MGSVESERIDSPPETPNFEDVDDLEHPELYLEEFGGVEESGQKSKALEGTSEGIKLRLPVSKIKHMMKLDPEAGKISLEALVLATKATEMFLDALAKEAFTHTVAAKKKTLQKNDVDVAVSTVEALFFLEGCFKN